MRLGPFSCYLDRSEKVIADAVPDLRTELGTVNAVYDKIYNAHAQYPRSLMPRFGHDGWLTPEQVADLVAFLLDPEPPVN